jgi:hypothetical protein
MGGKRVLPPNATAAAAVVILIASIPFSDMRSGELHRPRCNFYISALSASMQFDYFNWSTQMST